MKKLLPFLIFVFSLTTTNNYAQQFTEQISLTAVGRGSVAWGDYDNDGDLDILLTGERASPVSKIYRQNWNHTFTEQTSISLTGVYVSSVAWGDYDNDGYLDILLTGAVNGGAQISKIYRNNGNNTFTEQTSISLPGVSSSSVALGDYDNDGDLDILLTGSSNEGNISKIYRNEENNTFIEQTSISLTGVKMGSAAWGAYDNDGDLNILLTGFEYDWVGVSKIYQNNGNNTFTEQTSISLAGVAGSSVAWGDYDNDGNLDILLTGSSYTEGIVSKIYRNNGDNTFIEQTSISLIGVYSSSVAWGDYDNDGDLDILLTGSSDGTFSGLVSKIYRNNNSTPNTLPGVPSNLQALNNGNEVTLSWEKSSDIETPQNGLKYNLVIGKSQDAVDILSPMSDRNTGYRRVINLGNTNHCNSWTIKGLPEGQYYWSVQAVDNAFAGSNFASTDSFIIPGFIIITYPTGGEVFAVGSNPIITYTSVGNSGYLNLDYSTNGGLTWDTIATNTIDDGDWRSWIVPNTPSTNCKIRISDVDGNPSAISDSLFTIQAEGTIILTYPIGGEIFAVGSNPIIAYSSVGNSGYINLDYSINGGTTWDTIATNTIDDGDWRSWIVPNTPSTNCKIRISDVDGNPSVISNGSFAIGSQFTELTSFSLVDKSGAVDWGDYDNDGDLDILLQGTYYGGQGFSRIYRNDGNNIFTELNSITPTNVISVSAVWGDYDNDGDLDILLTGFYFQGLPLTKIYRNNGDNSFTEQTSIVLTGVEGGSAVWGDYDNDGDLDILLTGLDAGYYPFSKIYRNNGNNTFTEQTSISLIGVYEGSATWGDYDNDGDLDILLKGIFDYNYNCVTKIYRNNGDNTFTEQTSISLIGLAQGSAAWGDYDNDGDLDILLTGSTGDSHCFSKIYHNNGNNTFTEPTSISLVGVNGPATWADYDNDGDLDIFLSGYYDGYATGGTKIYRNDGNNTFKEQTSISLPIGSATWGDYDNDGDLDFLLTGILNNHSFTKIYQNNYPIPNTLPAAPSNLETAVNGNNVTFSWDKSTDNETQQNGLKYNLVIGSNPNAVDVLSPMSDRNTGYRRIINLGNTNHSNSWTIKDLPDGLYYWSVQAIDNNSAGSQFAPEQVVPVPIPVELTSLNATTKNTNVILSWETATELNNYGFEIERKVDNQQLSHQSNLEFSTWVKIGFVQGSGNSNSSKSYSYLDKNPTGGSKFEYRLKQIDFDGKFEYSNTVEVIIIPSEYKLFQNYPNPFNPTTRIRYSVSEEGLISIKVYDITGREVMTLINEVKQPGNYDTLFDGSEFSSGVYFYRMITRDFSATKQFMILK